MSLKHATVFASALTASVTAHSIVTEFTTDGVSNPGFQTDYIYRIQNGNPVPDLAAWSTSSLDRGYISPNALKSCMVRRRLMARSCILSA